MAFKLVIDWEGPGTPVKVNGPIADKMVCYAMLEAAKDAVRDYVEKNQKLVAVAKAMPDGG